MACLPESGRCEREQTDAFVHHLNRIEFRSFQHELCLDQIYRNTPQPEALYVEPDSGDRFVIERKTIAWPGDYIVRHHTDHLIADILAARVGPLTTDAAYAFILEASLRGRPGEVVAFAEQIAKFATQHLTRVRSGRAIGSLQLGRQWKLVRENARDRAAEGEPETGLMIRWYSEETLDLAQDPPQALLSEIERHFSSCVLKFREYRLYRRVLLLDPHGELRYLPDLWWHRVFQLKTPPEEISEVWAGIYDWVTERGQEWLFEKLYPMVADDRPV